MKHGDLPKLELIDKATLDTLQVDPSSDTDYALKYLEPMVRNGVRTYVDNIDGEMKLLVVDRKWILPIFIPLSSRESSYVASLYSHYVRYAIEELRELNAPILQLIAGVVIRLIGLLLRIAHVDRCVYVNNWLLSTNLYTDIPAEYLSSISQFIADTHPSRFVVWNSINTLTTPTLYQSARASRFVCWFSRSIYIHNHQDQLNSRVNAILRRESRLLKNSDYVFTSAFDAQKIRSLYNSLYITKYSIYNPMFTAGFMEHMYKQQLMTFRVLQDPTGTPKATVAHYSRQGIAAAPILGYDITLPQTDALYRIVSYRLLEDIAANNEILHASSGVGEFKRSRGATYTPEYRILYPGSFNRVQKIIFPAFEWILTHIVVPAFERRKL